MPKENRDRCRINDCLSVLCHKSGFRIVMVVFFLQRTLVGLCRDIRGLAFAFNSKSSYMMLFDWMYPLYGIGYCDFQLSEAREVWH